MTLTLGSIGLDTAGAVLNEKDAFAQGSRFRLRYSAGAGNSIPATQFKLCKLGEIAGIVASGQDFIANSEWYESRMTEGAVAGTADGAADLGFWSARGLKPGSSIYPSWDQAPDPGKFAAVEDYLGHYNAALKGEYVANGMYAGAAALRAMLTAKLITHGWLPESTSWSGLPSWYYQPTKAQLAETTAAVSKLVPGLTSLIWQDGNKWYSNGADENIIVLGTSVGSHLQAGGSTPVAPPKPPAPPVHPAPVPLYHNRPWPAYMQPGNYFGLITGPATSHGGYYPNEAVDVKCIQQKLVSLGYVPGHTNINDGWSDGKFQQPTADAVARFQHAHMPGTTYYGQVWSDDWKKLFSL